MTLLRQSKNFVSFINRTDTCGKKKRNISRIIFLIIVIYLILERIPVKRSISEEEANHRICEDETYICRPAATTGPPWEVYKQSDDMWQLACLEGNDPFDALNHGEFFFFANNKFLIQGEVVGKRIVDIKGNIKDYYGNDMDQCFADIQLLDGRCECYDIIHVSQWDIIEPFIRGDSLRFLAPKKYLSIWDFNWKAANGQIARMIGNLKEGYYNTYE